MSGVRYAGPMSITTGWPYPPHEVRPPNTDSYLYGCGMPSVTHPQPDPLVPAPVDPTPPASDILSAMRRRLAELESERERLLAAIRAMEGK